MSGQACPKLAPRGVYHLPWSGSDGERYLVVVDSRGTRIMEATVYRNDDLDAAEVALWDLLDRQDPPLGGRAVRLVPR